MIPKRSSRPAANSQRQSNAEFSKSEPQLRWREHCICFWGHDGAAEVPFFMEEAALLRIAPGTASGEAALLKSFDQHPEFIILAARKCVPAPSEGFI